MEKLNLSCEFGNAYLAQLLAKEVDEVCLRVLSVEEINGLWLFCMRHGLKTYTLSFTPAINGNQYSAVLSIKRNEA